MTVSMTVSLLVIEKLERGKVWERNDAKFRFGHIEFQIPVGHPIVNVYKANDNVWGIRLGQKLELDM